jgi:hypothetical protein
MTNPGYQYQPRKPSEKKKRMTKNKLAKLAAAKKPVSLLKLNEDKLAMSFVPGQDIPGQINSELEAFNRLQWPSGMPAISGQYQLPAFNSPQFVTNPVSRNDILQHPGPDTIENYMKSMRQAALSDPNSNENFQTTLARPALDEFDVYVEGFGNFNIQDISQDNFLPDEEPQNTEVLRQVTLNEEANDVGFDAYFNFDHCDFET